MGAQHVLEHRSTAELSVSPCSAGPGLVVVLGGEADWATADRLRDGLTAALAYGPRSMVIDLTDLVFCNLHGLRALIAVVGTAERAGVDVTLHGMSPQLRWLYGRFQAVGTTGPRHGRDGFAGSGSPRAYLRSVPNA